MHTPFFKKENKEILQNVLKLKFKIKILPINLYAKNLEILNEIRNLTKKLKKISLTKIFDVFSVMETNKI